MKVSEEVSLMSEKYSTMYSILMTLVLNRDKYIKIDPSDIVSVSFINEYDIKTFPIIRIRLYTDISVIQDMIEFPDSIYVRANITGNIYKMDDENEDRSPVPVAPVKPISFELKGYIENKNAPSSVMDQYELGLPRSNDLNHNVKSPIEIYCYDEYTIHQMQQKTQSIYKNMSLFSVISDIFNRNNIKPMVHMDTFNNQMKYDQILIPNLNISDTISFFDIKYGLYYKGGQMFCDHNGLWLCNTDVNANDYGTLPIYVRSAKSNDNTTGVIRINTNEQKYCMVVNAPNVSVKTETDIERVLNSPEVGAIDLNSIDVSIEEIKQLYTESMERSTARKTSGGINIFPINTPQILHKNNNDYVLRSYIARVNERITQIDISGNGFDIGQMYIASRYNIIFESPIRGLDINKRYRASYTCHVLSNINSDLFEPTTTMTLCTN